MGKRKSSAKAPPKKMAAKLDTTFPCPFCNAGMSYHPFRIYFHNPHPILPPPLTSLSLPTKPTTPYTEKSVHCEMDRANEVGQVKCSLCGIKYAVKIHALSEPIDVYRYVRLLSSLCDCHKTERDSVSIILS